MSSFALKVTATVLMVMNHTAAFFPAPVAQAMSWLGQLSSPLFLFVCAQSCRRTRSITRYVLRLYCASVAMSAVASLLGIDNNIFATLFHAALLIMIVSRSSRRNRAYGLTAYMAWQVASTAGLTALMPVTYSAFGGRTASALQMMLTTLLANGATLEGGYPYALLGLVLWACRRTRLRLAVGFVVYCLLFIVVCGSLGVWDVPVPAGVADALGMVPDALSPLVSIGWPPAGDCRWPVLLALPLMLAYNGRRGRPVKWFFYLFYPAHLAVIALVMRLCDIGFGA